MSHEEGGVLRTSIERGSRPGAAVLLCGALLLVPLLLIRSAPEASASPPGSVPDHHGRLRAHAAPVPRWRLASETKPTSVTASAPSDGTTPTPTDPGGPEGAGQAQTATPANAAVVARRVAPTTTTTSPPTTTTTTTAAVAVSGPVHYGQVTYYDHPPGTCASPWLTFGTVVSVTNPANGYTVTCVVNDREADTARSIDLATTTFAQLAPLSQGVIDAELHW